MAANLVTRFKFWVFASDLRAFLVCYTLPVALFCGIILTATGCTIGYVCHQELHRAPAEVAFPYYMERVCRRLMCESAVRLPSDATQTGRCE